MNHLWSFTRCTPTTTTSKPASSYLRGPPSQRPSLLLLEHRQASLEVLFRRNSLARTSTSVPSIRGVGIHPEKHGARTNIRSEIRSCGIYRRERRAAPTRVWAATKGVLQTKANYRSPSMSLDPCQQHLLRKGTYLFTMLFTLVPSNLATLVCSLSLLRSTNPSASYLTAWL